MAGDQPVDVRDVRIRQGRVGEHPRDETARRVLDETEQHTAELGSAIGPKVEAGVDPTVWVGSNNEFGDGRHGATPSCHEKKVSTSAASSARFAAGLPAPWPALPSWRSRTGRVSWCAAWCCNSAAILRAWSGSTRPSPSAAV